MTETPAGHGAATTARTKLIEVAIPLDKINAAAAREKSIRHGHPSTLHLWWARRPLAACRAVLFAQLVDDPSAVPEEFPTAAEQQRERDRLFRIIEQLVLWENSNNPAVLEAAQREIARSVARAAGLALPDTADGVRRLLAEHAPPLLDPFCGGGSIPLEAQRLGLAAHASDLNPVAVLITKALIELPPRFADRPPVNPRDRDRPAVWPGASGLAADVRYYGAWMRDEAQRRIGHLYPKVALSREQGGGEATVIAWLWARTVTCPNPACRAQMPLVRSFWLSTKAGKGAWTEPIVDHAAKTVRFEVRTGTGKPPEGTVNRRGARCIVCDTPVPFDHVRAEGRAGRMGQQMMAVVAEGPRGRVYISPDAEQGSSAPVLPPMDFPETELPEQALGFRVQRYGITQHKALFTARQLLAVATFSELAKRAAGEVLAAAADDASRAGAVLTYLALAVSRCAESWCSLARWQSTGDKVAGAFSRQALSMVWDFAEANPFSGSTRNFLDSVSWVAEALEQTPATGLGSVKQRSAASLASGTLKYSVSTDPPYYDNIGYADLSDFFYIWLRPMLRDEYPQIFGTRLTPKAEELIATPFRFGGDRTAAKNFFEQELGRAFSGMNTVQAACLPLTVYYAFKQEELDSEEGQATDGSGETIAASTGWETMLEGVLSARFSIVGTWPIRSERTGRPRDLGTNALASSIVLVCRPRPADAPIATRRQFVAALRAELPKGVQALQHADIAPVDLAQASIGPGMAVYSRYARVLEADGSPLPVRTALQLINQELEAYLAAVEGELDADSRFCVAWFSQYGMGPGKYGEAEVLARAKNAVLGRLVEAGVLAAHAGEVRLRGRHELDPAWDPRLDRRLDDWKCAQQLAVALYYDDPQLGGEAGAARLAGQMGPGRAQTAHDLAYRLYSICERKGWAEEGRAYNGLVASWPAIQAKITAAGDYDQGPML